MSEELLEVHVPSELVLNSDGLVITQEVPVVLTTTECETLLVDVPILEILEVGLQGPPGPPGSGGTGGSGFETILDTDYSNSTYCYVGTSSKISRVDYSASPPVVLKFTVTDYSLNWANRLTLGYA